ncbi:hypothetical protein NDN01_10135 [Sphingomonas sp. QA11]|uniref:hypothetical protein n=1 Tax=Sphingomonas sp. QA11 TaxID=2950605 RepID=UPI0023490C23|nr:hypothetical protein [Sphingomonas sp. QA11]WCM29212.1 hypothetical protein NDN01_10135 [Sphingomonas sp. QA11]
MTKLRAPLTFAAAVTRIAGILTFKGAARIVKRSTRCVYGWADPDAKSCPTLAQGLALDAAYRDAGGEGSPILEAYAFLLDIRVKAGAACRSALSGDLASVAKECGDAIASGIAVTQPGARPSDIHHALVEAEEARGALGKMMQRLKSFLSIDAGSFGESGGGATT